MYTDKSAIFTVEEVFFMAKKNARKKSSAEHLQLGEKMKW